MSLGGSAGGTGFRNRTRRAAPITAASGVGTPADKAVVGAKDPLTGTGDKTGGGKRSRTSDVVGMKSGLNPNIYGNQDLLKDKKHYGVGPLGTDVVHVLRRKTGEPAATDTTNKTKKKRSRISDTVSPIPPTMGGGGGSGI